MTTILDGPKNRMIDVGEDPNPQPPRPGNNATLRVVRDWGVSQRPRRYRTVRPAFVAYAVSFGPTSSLPGRRGAGAAGDRPRRGSGSRAGVTRSCPGGSGFGRVNRWGAGGPGGLLTAGCGVR